jgi:type I restriction enzyme, R subunit
LFASAIIDYDYIMGLIAKYTQNKPSKQKMTKEQLINLLSSSANLMDDREEIVEYINSLELGKALTEQQIKQGFQQFKAQKFATQLAAIAAAFGLQASDLQTFVDNMLGRMIFDGDQLTNLFQPLGLGWKERSQKEVALMAALKPILLKLAQGREISGLSAYE